VIRISIVTISFNNLKDVIATCKSVDEQKNFPSEHIIIDGSKTRDIKNWLESTAQPAYRRWICEPDKGIADAFNKGIRRAKGEVTLLLNSGDELYNESVLARVEEAFAQQPDLMWCHGKLKTMRGGLWVVVGKPFEKAKLYRGMRGVFHPTMFVKKELYDRHGLFNTDLKMAMDYDFLCRIADEKNCFIDHALTVFDPTGISSTKYEEAMQEAYACYRKYYGSTVKQTFWGWRLSILHNLLGSGFGKFLYKLKVKLKLENV
jgi:glycosyltransferase involved in cell wall biosynthesis